MSAKPTIGEPSQQMKTWQLQKNKSGKSRILWSCPRVWSRQVRSPTWKMIVLSPKRSTSSISSVDCHSWAISDSNSPLSSTTSRRWSVRRQATRNRFLIVARRVISLSRATCATCMDLTRRRTPITTTCSIKANLIAPLPSLKRVRQKTSTTLVARTWLEQQVASRLEARRTCSSFSLLKEEQRVHSAIQALMWATKKLKTGEKIAEVGTRSCERCTA